MCDPGEKRLLNTLESPASTLLRLILCGLELGEVGQVLPYLPALSRSGDESLPFMRHVEGEGAQVFSAKCGAPSLGRIWPQCRRIPKYPSA
jgi:hypothetical protein